MSVVFIGPSALVEAESDVEREISFDFLSPEERSERMGRIRGKDTQIELKVRRLVHSLGYRYRLHVRTLPGHPDLVFSRRKKVIFVHGCFWHLHSECRQYRLPRSKLDFWMPKLKANRERDTASQAKIREMGWDALVIWECELKDRNALASLLTSFLEDAR